MWADGTRGRGRGREGEGEGEGEGGGGGGRGREGEGDKGLFESETEGGLLAVFVCFPRRAVQAPTRLTGMSVFSTSCGTCSALREGERGT